MTDLNEWVADAILLAMAVVVLLKARRFKHLSEEEQYRLTVIDRRLRRRPAYWAPLLPGIAAWVSLREGWVIAAVVSTGCVLVLLPIYVRTRQRISQEVPEDIFWGELFD